MTGIITLADIDKYNLETIEDINLDEKLPFAVDRKEAKKMIYQRLYDNFIESNPSANEVLRVTAKCKNENIRKALKNYLKEIL